MYNPYLYNGNQFQPPIVTSQPQSQQVVRVHGEDGAKAYNLPPNSSALLLDETQNIVWLKMTDGAGYPTVTGYEINPIQNKVEKEYSSLEDRIRRIEEDIYGSQSNSASNQRSK